MRDLVRARETLRLDLMRARHRLSKMLMRHGVQFDDGRAWTERHRAWLKTVELEWPAAQTTLLDAARRRSTALVHRREHLEREIVAILPELAVETEVGRLRCLRGVDTLTAVGLCAEVGDFERFARAEQLMSYLGLVPSESTTGNTRRLGSITKTGSAHARRLLVEAAWHYRKAPAIAQDPDRATAGPTPRGGRDRVDRATPTAPHLGPAPSPIQAPHDHRRRRRSRALRVLLGDHPNRIASTRTPSRLAGSVAARYARGIRDVPMSNPLPGVTLDLLDSGTPRRTMVLRPPGSAHIRLTHVAHSTGPPPTQPTPTPTRPAPTARKSHARG